MMKVGITGGIGSGKSTVCRLFARRGVAVYDSDSEAKRLMTESVELRQRIAGRFGAEAYAADGGLNRSLLAARVFTDPQALADLNAMVHPAVMADFAAWAERQSGDYVVLESAILFEAGLEHSVDRTVAVLAPGEQRVQRIMQRDHIPEEYARLRIQAQKPDSYYREHCTDVLENQEETPEAFREKAEIFFRDLLRQLHHITEGGHEQ